MNEYKKRKSLSDLLQDKNVITSKDVIQRIKEIEKQQKEFLESVEVELRNRWGG